MSILSVSNLTKYFGAEFIFGKVSFQVARGDKIALVGVNGAGKSTLLKIIAGTEQPTDGSINIARGTRTAYLAQEARFSGDRTLWQEMQVAIEHLTRLQDEMTALEKELVDTSLPDWDLRMERYGELMHRFEHAGGYEIEHRIEQTLHGLGFSEAQYSQPLAQFSGGQKTRAALAATLLSGPDLLMLDEPTNHLDLAAIEWLERFLKTWEGALIIISHDRYFLDKVTNRTLDLAFGRLEDYPAAYNKYLQLKAERLELQLRQYQSQQEYIAKTEEFIRRFKAGQRSKEARGREARLNRLKSGQDRHTTLIERPQDQKKVAFKLGTQTRSGEIALKLDKLVVGYSAPDGDRDQPGDVPSTERVTLIRCPELEIQRGQRVALIGPNGSGKTTLLRTIVGELPPLRGQVRQGYNVAINYYAQSHEGLRMDVTILDEIRRVNPLIKETQARTLLGRFLFSGDDVFKQVGDLSGGERSRVALAQLTLMNGNLLVLDEPTNHLDIDAREALEGVLNEYNGSILFVSHDRYFIDAVADTIWIVQDGTITVFDGTYSEYVAAREEDAQPEPRAANRSMADGQKSAGQGKQNEQSVSRSGNSRQRNEASSAAAYQSKEDRKKQRQLAALEEEIAKLEAELKQVEQDMNTAGERGDVKQVTALGLQHVEVQERLNVRYDEWAAVAG